MKPFFVSRKYKINLLFVICCHQTDLGTISFKESDQVKSGIIYCRSIGTIDVYGSGLFSNHLFFTMACIKHDVTYS